MSDSILLNVKQMLGLLPDQTSFDAEIILFTNSAIGTLTQLGVGPSEGFEIASEEQNWADFVGNTPKLNPIKAYVNLRVKLLFDPPTIGFVLTAMKEQIQELEWRLNIVMETEVDPIQTEPMPAEEID